MMSGAQAPPRQPGTYSAIQSKSTFGPGTDVQVLRSVEVISEGPVPKTYQVSPSFARTGSWTPGSTGSKR